MAEMALSGEEGVGAGEQKSQLQDIKHCLTVKINQFIFSSN